ncbi:sugar phosphate isomerase/epimerase [Bifidobacterium sp. 82T24]|uniref:TIM barrel protein n=1 Tax=Bifidobacterium saimiriisciurei TaxID=2661627 RepID=A0ABX0CDN2_9BIFI|nr:MULTISPECIES: sugar phosphate isomerase/epimerase [Bifidobacterium]MBW3088743.1 sugar phosphate isomerase/epimerase [Bifidobacterium pluvialisilvae]NEG96364.1 TIM barrel protein [Bifidobacterium sp. SMB2]NEH11004.1 TIM barrel protein [Bifidobacterium saimiriisciurei]
MTALGINTLVYLSDLANGVPQSTLLPRIADLGAGLAEVRREYIVGADGIDADVEFDRIAAARRAGGLGLFYSVPEVITAEGAANPELATYFAEARRMGAKNVKLNQGDVKDVSADVLHGIDALAAEYGVSVTIENDQTPENGTFVCTASSLENIKDAGSAIGYTFDLGNWLWRDEDPDAAFAALHGFITVFHLKNANGAEKREDLVTTMLDDGVIDWRELVAQLGDDVPVFLEFPIPADRVAEQFDIVRAALA